jgi:hypothetical protein
MLFRHTMTPGASPVNNSYVVSGFFGRIVPSPDASEGDLFRARLDPDHQFEARTGAARR